MLPDPQRVTDIMRSVARDVVLPRFRSLASHEVSEKAPGDLVTVADVEAEAHLAKQLMALLPGSVVVGEEDYERNPAVLAAFDGTDPVWVVDPVDGTYNFAHGVPCFAMIVGLCRDGETLAGWIHDPVVDRTAWTIKGEGAWLGGKRLAVGHPSSRAECVGSLGNRMRAKLDEMRSAGNAEVPGKLVRYRCVGQEYIDLASGKMHFARYAGRLKPWDHAAGVLMHAEAGGFSQLIESRMPYTPREGILRQPLFLAPDRASWDILHTIVSAG
jgi:fructose-1,6-bisphosphatase/inositol monophosphatase family enzyme